MSDEYEHKLEAKSDYATDASSVSTPDIDSVPKFESTIITKKELEDLCYLSNTDIKEIEECIKKIDIEK